MSGQRRYDTTALYRLAIIQRARQLGFTFTEIRHLFLGFRDITRASERWRTLSQKKLGELDDLMDGIKAARSVLKKVDDEVTTPRFDFCQPKTLADPSRLHRVENKIAPLLQVGGG
jgi:DNA-binding transcriptional MerR regulator